LEAAVAFRQGLAKIRRMTKLCLRVSLLATLVVGVLACTPTDPKFAFKYAEKRGVLAANGLRFVIAPDASTQLVEVDVRYEVGSREDPEGKAGLAHLVEHLMFQLKPDGEGTPPLMHFVNQLSTFFNAYTNWDTTHYMTTSRSAQLEALLKIEAMRLYYGCKTISEDEFLREREVVRNEIRQRGGTADGQIPNLVLESLYPKGHAYARIIGGDDRQLVNISLQDACDFMSKYYVPERATVIIAGGVDVEETGELIQKWFGKLEKKTPGARKVVEPVKPKPGKHEYNLDIERNIVTITWPLPATNTPEGEAVQYGLGQAFFRTAMKAEEYDFAYSVQPMLLGGNEAPIFSIVIELKGMDKLGEALEFVEKAAKSAHRGFRDVTWQQFDIQRKQAKADYIAGLEQLVARTNQIGEMVQFEKEVQFGSAEEYIIHGLEKYDSFDGDRIASAIKKYLDYDNATIDIFKADKEGIKGDVRSTVKFQTKSHDQMQQPEVDPKEAKRPLKVSAELKALANAERYELGNGMDVVLLPVDSILPVVSMQLIFDAGTAHSKNPMIADWAAGFLSTPMDDEATRMAGVGYNGYATTDQTVFQSRTLNIYLDVMIKGAERLIKAGEYDQESVERVQKRSREQMATQSAQTEMEFQRQLLGAIFGTDHPYARVELPEHARGFGIDDLNAWRREHYRAGNATLVIAGNFDVAKAKSLIGGTFGEWSKGNIDAPIGAELRARNGAEFIGVVGKAGPQMQVAIAYPAPAGIDGEEGARMVLAEMMNSRMGDIRFKLGATYGTYAGRMTNLGPSAYQMGGTVDAERAGEALKAMRDGIQMLRDGGDQWDIDFVRARRALIQNLLGESTVSGELVGRLAKIDKFHLDPDFYNKLMQTVAAVSPAQVKALIARELDPSKEIVVTVADKSTLERAFKEAGLNDVKIVEPEYK
jgi:zinc protease